MLNISIVAALFALLFGFAHCTYDGDSFRGSLERPLAQAACYRLFSSEGDIGCRTASSAGTSGAMFEVNSIDDIKEAIELNMDLAYVLPASLLTPEVLGQLPRPQGVIVVEDDGIWSTVARGMYSPEAQRPQGAGTPQQSLTLNPETVWNTRGNGLSLESFSFPIVRADTHENEIMRNYCAENRRYGYRSTRVNYADFKFYMGKSGLTSKDCLEWRNIYGDRSPQCIPLGGQSIWGTAALLDERPKVLGTVGIDSTAMFHDIAFGANDAAATVAAFLGAVEAIGRFNHETLESQILLFAANAEEWGYAGSRKFVQDIKSFTCNNYIGVAQSHVTGIPMCADPVYPSMLFTKILKDSNVSNPEGGIKFAIALDQIGSINQVSSDGDTELHIHSSKLDSTVLSKIKIAAESTSKIILTPSTTTAMPPSPLSSFSRELGALSEECAVITGYGDSFTDPRYHSHYDNASFVSDVAVIRASELFAKSLITMAGGDASTLKVNETWIRSALNCLLTDWNCKFFAGYANSEKNNMANNLGYSVYMSDGISFYSQSGQPMSPPSYYTGVLAPYSGQPVVNHKGTLYGKFTDNWNEHDDKIYSTPSLLEAIIRTTISYHLGQKNSLHFLSIAAPNSNKVYDDATTTVQYDMAEAIPEGEQRMHCSTSVDCDPYFCELFHYEIPMVKLECLLGVCVCPVASYHLALDPGLAAETSPGFFTIINDTAPIYTEPNWAMDVGVVTYPKTNTLVVYVTVVIGSIVAVLSILYSSSGKGFFPVAVAEEPSTHNQF